MMFPNTPLCMFNVPMFPNTPPLVLSWVQRVLMLTKRSLAEVSYDDIVFPNPFDTSIIQLESTDF